MIFEDVAHPSHHVLKSFRALKKHGELVLAVHPHDPKEGNKADELVACEVHRLKVAVRQV